MGMNSVELNCGCEVTSAGKFVLGDACREKGCEECTANQELHPFGDKHYADMA